MLTTNLSNLWYCVRLSSPLSVCCSTTPSAWRTFSQWLPCTALQTTASPAGERHTLSCTPEARLNPAYIDSPSSHNSCCNVSPILTPSFSCYCTGIQLAFAMVFLLFDCFPRLSWNRPYLSCSRYHGTLKRRRMTLPALSRSARVSNRGATRWEIPQAPPSCC